MDPPLADHRDETTLNLEVVVLDSRRCNSFPQTVIHWCISNANVGGYILVILFISHSEWMGMFKVKCVCPFPKSSVEEIDVIVEKDVLVAF